MRYYLAVLIVLAACILFFRLGNAPLQSWDEAIYAQSAKEMLQSGDYLTPHWNGEKFLQKPPLAIWTTAALFRIFGVNETSARATSALAGIGCVVLVFLIGRLFLSDGLAFLAGLVLLLTPHFNFYARQGGMDVPLTFFILLSLFAFLKSQSGSRWLLLAGIAAGLAVLTKGIAAAPLFVALLLAIALNRRVLHSRHFWIALGLCCAIAGSWHFAMAVLYGQDFAREYVGQQMINRSTSVIDGGPQPIFFFGVILFYGLLPLTFLLPFALYRVYKYRRFPVVLLAFAVTMLALYSIVTTKHPWYIVPVYPVLALLIASLNRVRVTVLLAAVALVHCVLLSQAHWGAYELERQRIQEAKNGRGLFVSEMNVAPAVLFYSDRKICALPNNHTMAPLAKCDSVSSSYQPAN